MVYGVRKESKAWKESDQSKHTFFMEDNIWGALRIMGETALFNS